jgi:hypothetical protein
VETRSPTLDWIKRNEILILLLCLLVGFTLRFHTFDRKSLWLDEIYTFQDSRDGFRDQLKFYKENPTFLHPPLFFILTHQFYPFTKPERDLRIIPLIFGALSIPMIYLLARQFSSYLALPSALCLTFMTYHISLSQEGRSYSMLLFTGMAGLYFFMKYLQLPKKKYLFSISLFFSILFYTSYSSIPFILFSQILWFYRPNQQTNKPTLTSFFILNSFILLFCLPWIIYLSLNYRGQPLMNPFHAESPGSLWAIMYWILNDWSTNIPLTIISVTLIIILPFFLKDKRNAFLLFALIVLPITVLYLFCKTLNITHFFTSRYFVTFLPLFLIAIFFSLNALEKKFQRLKRHLSLSLLFSILFLGSNLAILPLYYTSQKQDFKGLVHFLKSHLRPGDKIFDGDRLYTPGILFYFGVNPVSRHYTVDLDKQDGEVVGLKRSFYIKNHIFTIYYSNTCCNQYTADGSRLWIIVGKRGAIEVEKNLSCKQVGYFDGSFLNYNKFPSDASMYLFLLDPKSPNEKGIDFPVVIFK